MRIVDERVAKDTHLFHALRAGDVFYHPNTPEEMLMKIYSVMDEDANTLNAVSLTTGELDYWGGGELVCIANAELVIRD